MSIENHSMSEIIFGAISVSCNQNATRGALSPLFIRFSRGSNPMSSAKTGSKLFKPLPVFSFIYGLFCASITRQVAMYNRRKMQ